MKFIYYSISNIKVNINNYFRIVLAFFLFASLAIVSILTAVIEIPQKGGKRGSQHSSFVGKAMDT